MSADLRARLLARCGVPEDCGWTDDQLFELIDLGLRHNSPTPPESDDDRARRAAAVRDVAWALNCHNIDTLTGIADDLLAGHLLQVAESLARAHIAQGVRAST